MYGVLEKKFVSIREDLDEGKEYDANRFYEKQMNQ